MKMSYKIIISLTVILILGLSGLFTYEYYINKNQPSQNQEEAENTQDNVITSDFESEKKPIVPFTSMTESNGSLYITKSLSSSANLENVNIIPIESDFFTIIGEDVYYITNGSDEFAPELRRCGLDGNNDVSISEFVSPLGSPVVIGDYIYSAYYTDADEGLNNGIYKINIGSGETEKAIEGEYFIYGYDNDKIYYTSNLENRGSGTILHRMNFDGTDKTEVLNFSVRTDSIVVYDKYIFFSAYDDISHCYKIYRSPKSGKGNIDAYSFECFSNVFDVIDGRLYYQANSAVYSSEINGDNEIKLADIDEKNDSAYGFKKFDNKIYFYEKSTQGDILYQADLETGKKLNISK